MPKIYQPSKYARIVERVLSGALSGDRTATQGQLWLSYAYDSQAPCREAHCVVTHKLGKRKRPATNMKLFPQLLDCVKDIRLIGLLGFRAFLPGYMATVCAGHTTVPKLKEGRIYSSTRGTTNCARAWGADDLVVSP